jgi:hypothetical protein
MFVATAVGVDPRVDAEENGGCAGSFQNDGAPSTTHGSQRYIHTHTHNQRSMYVHLSRLHACK